jgi:hypothetical protein
MGLFRKSGGGGFLNGVDAVITGYEFTDQFAGQAFDPKAKKKDGSPVFHALNVVLSTRTDGASEDQTVNLMAGGYEDYEVSADGLTIEPNREGGQLSADLPFGILVNSAVDAAAAAGLDLEGRLTPTNFEGLIGTRVRFIQQTDEAATKKFGKVKNKKDPKHPGYDRKNLGVETVYELGSGKAKVAAKGAAAPKGAKKAAGAVDVNALAADTLIAIIDAAGGSVKKSRLSTASILALKGNDSRDAVRKLYASDEFLSSVDGVTFDEEAQTVSLA